MPDIAVFCEDSFHEQFIAALLQRYQAEHGVPVGTRFLSAQGGLSRMHGEFKDFLRDLARERTPLPAAVIVVVDANCLGHVRRRDLFDHVVEAYPAFSQLVHYAIPDPHIERWMLADPRAFQAVFGRGCTCPAVKCAKDEYKRLLRREIRGSGIDPPRGGEEYAADIVAAMDLGYVEIHETSLGLFLKVLKGLFNGWRRA